MRSKDAFSGFHPAINFLYFSLVLIFSMFFLHPVSLSVSLISAASYLIYLNGTKGVQFSMTAVLPLLLLAAILNPVFNHEGATILTYLPSGNPLTLESLAFGLASAMMLTSVILWFGCYNTVMTSDKFVYLFGRVIPALSLVLSMTLRFIPKFRAQARVILQAQACVGRDLSTGSILQRAKNGATVLSILITWALENAIETADSMKSRGYGLPGRTAFSIYRFDARDRLTLIWLCFCGTYILSGWAAGGLQWRWYPTIKGTLTGAFPLSFQLVYLCLCLTPLALDLAEDRAWKTLKGAA